MPLYEYRCVKCGETTEVLQKYSDPPLERCAKCRGKLEKLLSRSSFQLKGGGWYAQGYGPGGKSPATTASEGKAKSDGGGKSDGGAAKTGKSGGGKSDRRD